MRTVIFTLFFLLTSTQLCSQASHIQPKDFNEAQKGVLRIVLSVFESMRTSDSSRLAQILSEELEMITLFTDKYGKQRLQKGNVRGFKNAVASEKDAVWDEPVWNISIDIHGDLAVAQMDYAFYLGKKLLHCGVDVMLLHKVNGLWKIYHISDTRSAEDCKVPEELARGE